MSGEKIVGSIYSLSDLNRFVDTLSDKPDTSLFGGRYYCQGDNGRVSLNALAKRAIELAQNTDDRKNIMPIVRKIEELDKAPVKTRKPFWNLLHTVRQFIFGSSRSREQMLTKLCELAPADSKTSSTNRPLSSTDLLARSSVVFGFINPQDENKVFVKGASEELIKKEIGKLSFSQQDGIDKIGVFSIENGQKMLYTWDKSSPSNVTVTRGIVINNDGDLDVVAKELGGDKGIVFLNPLTLFPRGVAEVKPELTLGELKSKAVDRVEERLYLFPGEAVLVKTAKSDEYKMIFMDSGQSKVKSQTIQIGATGTTINGNYLEGVKACRNYEWLIPQTVKQRAALRQAMDAKCITQTDYDLIMNDIKERPPIWNSKKNVLNSLLLYRDPKWPPNEYELDSIDKNMDTYTVKRIKFSYTSEGTIKIMEGNITQKTLEKWLDVADRKRVTSYKHWEGLRTWEGA